MRVKVALIGHGFLGKWHLDKILACPDAQLAAIVEKMPKVREELAKRFPDLPIVEDLEAVIPLIDAAIVSTPTAFHHAVCVQLLKAGKHIFCEKPMTSTLIQARELEELAKKSKVVVQVGHSERFHAAWEMIAAAPYASMLKDAPLAYFDRWAPFKGRATDVDVAQDLMIHDLDLALFLFKEYPTKVSAKGLKNRSAHWDYAHAILDFPSGRQVHVRAGRTNVQEVRLMELVAPAGALKVDLMTLNVLAAPSTSLDIETRPYAKRDHLLIEQQAFYKAILTGSPVPVTLQDGVRGVALVEAVVRALESGAPVVP